MHTRRFAEAIVGLAVCAAHAAGDFRYVFDPEAQLVYEVTVTDRDATASSKLCVEMTVVTASVDEATGTAFRTVTAQLKAMEQSQGGKPMAEEVLAQIMRETKAHLATESCRVLQTDRGYLVLRPEKSSIFKGPEHALFAFPVPEIGLTHGTPWSMDLRASPVTQKRNTSLYNDVSTLDCVVTEVDDRHVKIAFRGRSEYSKWHGTKESTLPVSAPAPARLFDFVVTGHVVLDRNRGCVESILWEERSVSWDDEDAPRGRRRDFSWRLLPTGTAAQAPAP